MVRQLSAFAWMPWIDNPHAVHSHYLRTGNGWEVWPSERVRGYECYIEALEEVCDSDQLARAQASVPNDIISHARTADEHSNPPRKSGS